MEIPLPLMGGMVIASIALVVYALWPKSDGDADAIKRRMAGRKAQSDGDTGQVARESVAKRVMQTVAPIAVRPSMTQDVEEMSKLRIKLAQAGIRSETATTVFLASKTVVAVILGSAAIAYLWMLGTQFTTAAGIVMCAAGAGFLAPNLWLSSAKSKRGTALQQALPDTLDMLVISVESGLGLDAAFQRVGDEMQNVHPILAEELQIVTLESQMGIARNEALHNLSVRTGIDEVKSLVAIINQTERFGTSIARALRNQSDALRVKRRQKAEEAAQKTTVKLMLPLILFIFPAMLVVLVGPAALKVLDTLTTTPGLM